MKVTKSKIAAALREAVFSPATDRIMSIVADKEDVCYNIKRAQEELTLAYNTCDPTEFRKHLNNALKLIALVKVQENNG